MGTIISGWNLSWSEGMTSGGLHLNTIISGWNLSWSEGFMACTLEELRDYIRLESELE